MIRLSVHRPLYVFFFKPNFWGSFKCRMFFKGHRPMALSNLVVYNIRCPYTYFIVIIISLAYALPHCRLGPTYIQANNYKYSADFWVSIT